jgi:uncharacterized protein
MDWWLWPIALFAVTFAIGIVAVLAGVGGGVLFVPIVGALFPFHLDFVRAAGLPLALAGSVTSIAGALIGLALPTDAMQLALGITILAIALLMWRSRGSDRPVETEDPLAAALRMNGVYHDAALGRDIEWRVRRTPAAFVVFAGIGLLAGMFGLGAGWANVPAFNLLMGAPLKLAVGSSGLLLSVVDTSAAWIYLNRGAVLPIIVAPSIIGVMLGAKVGARLLRKARPELVRRTVIALLLVAGARALLKGLGV